MSDAPHATISEDDGIITVTMDRQDKLNAISPQITAAFWEATEALATRSDLRVMVIAAKGRYFTAGIDLASRPTDEPDEAARKAHPGWTYRRNYRKHHLLYDEFEAIEKPIVLAAQGTCFGAGVEMAASCDFRFCTPGALWALPEVNIGVIPGSGGATRLTRLVGPAWTKYLAMAGMRIDAQRALQIGLVHDIFPEESFLDDVYAFCRKLIELPPDAVGVAKLVIDMAVDADRTAQRHIDRIANQTLVESEAHAQAIARFKR